MIRRKPYPSDVSDEEWSLVAPYLTLMREDASQREHSLRELFNGLRYVIRYGIAWRAMPNDLPPWFSIYQQARRWLAAGVFETLSQDLRAVLRLAAGRHEEPTAAIIDSRTLRSTPESGPRAGYDGAKRKRGSKLTWGVCSQEGSLQSRGGHRGKAGREARSSKRRSERAALLAPSLIQAAKALLKFEIQGPSPIFDDLGVSQIKLTFGRRCYAT
jgi:transposase